MEHTEHTDTRRGFIKKGAMVGGVAWAAPTILSMGTAHAEHGPYPHNCPDCPTCSASATGLILPLGITAGTASGTGCVCTVVAGLNADIASASAQVVCGKADSASCSASSLVTGAVVRVAANVTLEASLLSSCVQCGTGDSQVLDLELVTTLFGSTIREAVTVNGGCNEGISLLGGLVAIVLNEQICSGGTTGTLTVNALRVTVAGLTVIAAQSSAGGSDCPCEPCSQAATCTPPTTALC